MNIQIVSSSRLYNRLYNGLQSVNRDFSVPRCPLLRHAAGPTFATAASSDEVRLLTGACMSIDHTDSPRQFYIVDAAVRPPTKFLDRTTRPHGRHSCVVFVNENVVLFVNEN